MIMQFVTPQTSRIGTDMAKDSDPSKTLSDAERLRLAQQVVINRQQRLLRRIQDMGNIEGNLDEISRKQQEALDDSIGIAREGLTPKRPA